MTGTPGIYPPDDEPVLQALVVPDRRHHGVKLFVGIVTLVLVAIVSILLLANFNPFDDGSTYIERWANGEEDGIDFRSAEGSFTANFPSEPEETTDENPPDGFTSFTRFTSRPGGAYQFEVAVGQVDPDAVFPDPLQPLRDQFDAQRRALGGELIDSSETTVGFVPAIDGAVRFTDANGAERVASYRVIFTGPRVYVIRMISAEREQEPFQRFTDGVVLGPQEITGPSS